MHRSAYGKTIFQILLDWYREWNIARRQNIFCWCPVCDFDLVKDSYVDEDINGVVYRCTNCSARSVWNFDAAPVPILIEHDCLGTSSSGRLLKREG